MTDPIERTKSAALRFLEEDEGRGADGEIKGADTQPEEDATGLCRQLEERIIKALRGVYDPEIPVNIYDLGLIYFLEVDAETGTVRIEMTLTTPGCPVAQTFPATVEEVVNAVPGVEDVEVNLVWDPPWSQERISEAARLQLGLL